ncbi:MAG: ABC transporter substrate-binding protein [Spirulinaceae cyanobacterium RM2_2_10]|nr:ABC transporter substrate-binding protein [Spirulinaceae cyanobacterium SM2_1_0]NJO20027.1 ABC transporter substrate-binding protein [Spirulinaceae cyanobacterium RM2_2_10]
MIAMRFLVSHGRAIALAVIVYCCLVLNACASLPPTDAATTINSQVVESVLSDPKTFNAVLSEESPNIFGLTYEGLVQENPITAEVEPRLAESWEIADDQLNIIFTLREGLRWSDGAPLTVDDVVFSYNQLYFNEEIPTNVRDSLRVGQSKILPTVTKLDERRVQFSVPEPFAPFLRATSLSILPEHILADTVTARDEDGDPLFISTWGIDTPPEEIIVNGPYRLQRYETTQRLVFEPNPYYWRRDDQGQPLPYIQQIVWEIVESTDTALLQFRSGSLDRVAVSPEFFSLLKREEERGQFEIYNGGPAYGTSFISFNLNTGRRDGKPLVDPVKSRWFNDVRFRQAIATSIDRQRMINNIFRGLGQPQNSPISVQSPYYYEGLKGYDYDPERARELFLEAGFRYNDRDELEDADGNRVRFALITNAGNKIREAMGTQIQQDLRKLGIQVDFTPIAFNVLVDRLTNSLDWECFLLGLTGGNEPNGGANIWFTDGNLHMFNQEPQPGREPIIGRTIADWEEEIANLYIQAARELDEEKRKAIYAETQRLAEEYVPFIYLVNPLSLGAVRDRFQGIEYSALGGAFWNIESLKLQE